MNNKYVGAQLGVNHYKEGCKLSFQELAAILKKKWNGGPIHCPKCYDIPKATQ